jgi:hypothetical protein
MIKRIVEETITIGIFANTIFGVHTKNRKLILSKKLMDF